MKSRLIELAKEQKISKIGFCLGEDYVKYSSKDKSLPEGADSIIVCAFGYYAGAGEGNISRYARGMDYHLVTRKKMSVLAEFLHSSGYFAESFADISSLDERLLAQLSGIAFRGRNGMSINEELGSYFFIGYILTDCPLEPDGVNKNACIGCAKCEKSCPMGAISSGGFKKERCISYINQKKGELTEEETNGIKNSGYGWGCDICQEVCPHNKGIPVTEIEEFRTDLIYNLEIDEKISNKEFKNRYHNRAFSWRGKAVLVRNQRIFEDLGKKT